MERSERSGVRQPVAPPCSSWPPLRISSLEQFLRFDRHPGRLNHRDSIRLRSNPDSDERPAATDKLTPDLRKVIELRDLGELSTEEAARRMGLSVSATKSSVLRDRRKLREALKRYVRARLVALRTRQHFQLFRRFQLRHFRRPAILSCKFRSLRLCVFGTGLAPIACEG